MTYDNILRLSDDPDVNDVIRFLREREIVHFQRFGEAVQLLREKLDEKNVYYMNPALIWSSIASFAATTLVIYVPFLADAFEFEHISLTEYAIALGLAFLVIPIVEIIKFFQRKATAANAR